MKPELLRIKQCGSDLFGVDREGMTFRLWEGQWEEIGHLKFDLDFHYWAGSFWTIYQRRLYRDGKPLLEDLLSYPGRVKGEGERLWLLDQEKGTLYGWDERMSLISSLGSDGLAELEGDGETAFSSPIDFDICGDNVIVADTGNRRVVYLEGKKKRSFPLLARKVRFFDEQRAALLFGQNLTLLSLPQEKAETTVLENLLDFEIFPSLSGKVVYLTR